MLIDEEDYTTHLKAKGDNIEKIVIMPTYKNFQQKKKKVEDESDEKYKQLLQDNKSLKVPIY